MLKPKAQLQLVSVVEHLRARDNIEHTPRKFGAHTLLHRSEMLQSLPDYLLLEIDLLVIRKVLPSAPPTVMTVAAAGLYLVFGLLEHAEQLCFAVLLLPLRERNLHLLAGNGSRHKYRQTVYMG